MNCKRHCIGCRNNFYNGNNNLGVTECRSLKSAKMETRFQLGTNVPMNIKEAYYKTRKPNCYHASGYVFLKEIPSYAQTKTQRDAERAQEEARNQTTITP